MSALTDFRQAYSAMLLAAERLRAEVDPECSIKAPPEIRRIQAAVGVEFGIPLPRLLSRCRDDDTAVARHVAMLLCRELTSHNLVAIGDAFGRDHGSVTHGLRAITARMEQSPKLRGIVGNIRQNIRVLA